MESFVSVSSTTSVCILMAILFKIQNKTCERNCNSDALCCAINDKLKNSSFVCITWSPACHFCDSPFFTIHCKVHERWQPPWRTRAIASEKKIIIITKNNNLEASQLDLVTWERVEHVLTPNSHTHLVSLNHKWLVENIREGVGLEKGLQLACLDRQRKVTWERHPVLIERLDRNPEIPVW